MPDHVHNGGSFVKGGVVMQVVDKPIYFMAMNLQPVSFVEILLKTVGLSEEDFLR
jgi:hypothetical protein